jgi:hypothetical protein
VGASRLAHGRAHGSITLMPLPFDPLIKKEIA